MEKHEQGLVSRAPEPVAVPAPSGGAGTSGTTNTPGLCCFSSWSDSLPLGKGGRNQIFSFIILDLACREKVLQGRLCQDIHKVSQQKQNKGKLFDLYGPDALSQGSSEHEAALPIQVCDRSSWLRPQRAALSLFPLPERPLCSRADHRGVLGTEL